MQYEVKLTVFEVLLLLLWIYTYILSYLFAKLANQ